MKRFRLGDHSRRITTTSPEAQAWFDLGLNWCFAFNHEDGVKCFRHAAAKSRGPRGRPGRGSGWLRRPGAGRGRIGRAPLTRLELDAQTLDIDPDEVASLREQIVGQITRELVYTDALEPRVEADRLSVRMEPFIAMVIESGAGAATLMNVRGIDMDEILAAATVEVDPEIGTWRADVLRITTPVGQSPSIQSDGDR